MKIAFISDVHGNLEALSSVLEDIEKQSDIELICCTGDIVGYYPQPLKCIELIRKKCQHVIIGNHDEVVIDKNFKQRVSWFNEIAREALTWTRKRLLEPDAINQYFFLESLPISKEIIIEEKSILLAHGTPNDNWEYFLYPIWLDEPLPKQKGRIHKWLKTWDLVVLGHTHQPFIYKFRKQKILLNPGSVGQPRDGNPKASYAIVDISKTAMHSKIIRLEYDIKVTCKALNEANLHEYLCQRLFSGN